MKKVYLLGALALAVAGFSTGCSVNEKSERTVKNLLRFLILKEQLVKVVNKKLNAGMITRRLPWTKECKIMLSREKLA